VLVNNAGILRDGLLWSMTDEDWDAVLDVVSAACCGSRAPACRTSVSAGSIASST
jgi:NAD(P)-dependent dehydrogenase (short-subunit alcohol dehydrogenase family)